MNRAMMLRKRLSPVAALASLFLPLSLPFCLALLCTAEVRASDRKLDALVDDIKNEVRPDEAMTWMREIWETDRWFTFPKFGETARNIETRLKSIGLSQVEVIHTPADGTTKVGYWTIPQAWDVKQATLEIIDPEPAPEFRRLADYQKIPASLGMWSGPTPPEGVEAEVVVLPDPSAATFAKLDLKGKLVLTSSNPAGFKARLVKAGALGAINTFTENTSLKHGHQWINAWGDTGWAFIKTSTPLLSFSISPSQSGYLRGLLKKGKVRLRAKVGSRYYDGDYPYVTGLIEGSGPEEVLILGHTSEPGAQDNATGIAAITEAMALLQRLIGGGRLPKPKRGIRMLALGEMYGSMHYIQSNPERVKRTVGAVCMDTPAGPYEMAGTEYTYYGNPAAGKSYTDVLIVRVAGSYFDRLEPPRPWRFKPYMAGTDNYLGEPSVNIPTAWLYAGSGVHTHHNSEDTPERVDSRSLRDVAAVAAAYLYTLATAGESDALWLADAGLTQGYGNVLKSYDAALREIEKAATGTALTHQLHRAVERIEYSVGRETQAILSVQRLVPARRRDNLRHSLEPIVARLDRFGTQQAQRLGLAANRRARELGLAQLIIAIAPPDPRMEEARQIIVKRKRPGLVILEEVPAGQRRGFSFAGWWGPHVSALYWSDGKRNLAEVIRLTELELGPSTLDFVAYFRFLKKHGYVDFVE